MIAVIEYLVRQYDTKTRLNYDDLKEQSLCDPWLTFQISGQGPSLPWPVHMIGFNVTNAVFENKIQFLLM